MLFRSLRRHRFTRHSPPGSLVVFVPFVMVGETVAAQVTEVKKNFARAKLLRVITPSPERVEPQCHLISGMRLVDWSSYLVVCPT